MVLQFGWTLEGDNVSLAFGRQSKHAANQRNSCRIPTGGKTCFFPHWRTVLPAIGQFGFFHSLQLFYGE